MTSLVGQRRQTFPPHWITVKWAFILCPELGIWVIRCIHLITTCTTSNIQDLLWILVNHVCIGSTISLVDISSLPRFQKRNKLTSGNRPTSFAQTLQRAAGKSWIQVSWSTLSNLARVILRHISFIKKSFISSIPAIVWPGLEVFKNGGSKKMAE